jgi:hypothetical protein
MEDVTWRLMGRDKAGRWAGSTVRTRRECDPRYGNSKSVRHIVETCGQHRSLSTSDEAVPAESQESTVSSPRRPVEWVIRMIVRLRVEDNAIRRLFLLNMVDTERLVPAIGEQQHGSWKRRLFSSPSR